MIQRFARLVVVVAAATAAIVPVACVSPEAAPIVVDKGTVIQNVTVVDTRDGSLRPGQSVVIDGHRITRIEPARSLRATGEARVVEATGRYVVPGYLDMHTHVLPTINLQPGLWSVLLAHGVTGVRQMLGSAQIVQQARALNQRRQAGQLDAPEIVLSPGELVFNVADAADATRLVRHHQSIGADFIKLADAPHDGTLALIAEARKGGLPVAGHLPLSVTSMEVADAGMHALEHFGALPGMLLDCTTDATQLRRAFVEAPKPPFTPMLVVNPVAFRPADVPLFKRLVETFDEGRCQDVVARMVERRVWQVPTLIRDRAMALGNDASFRNDPNNALVDRTTRALWQRVADQYARVIPADGERAYRDFYALQQRVVRLFKQRGAALLAGTDLGGGWVVPGWSLHQEFRELAAAGLTPLDVLQATTINGARFLQREATMGSVDVGKNADLVLLTANPLEDVANLGRIDAVFLAGRYLPKQQLDRMKNDAVQGYAATPAANVLSAIDPGHRH